MSLSIFTTARLVDDGVVGERAEQAHETEVVTVGRVVAGGAIGDLATGRERRAADVTEVRVTRRTARATTARGDEPEHDVVADFETDDVGADLHHDAGTLVPADERHR